MKLILFPTLLLLTFPVFAQANSYPSNNNYSDPTANGYGNTNNDPYASLNLTPQQRQQIQPFISQEQSLKQQKRNLRQQLKAAQQSGNQAQVTQIEQQLAGLQGQFKSNNQAIRQYLSPEQIQTWKQNRQERRQRLGQRVGHP